MVLTCDKPLEGDVLIMYTDSGSRIENQPQELNHLQGHGNLRDSDSSKGFYKYIDLDGKKGMIGFDRWLWYTVCSQAFDISYNHYYS